ncbi:hypothetical protein [Ancylobacter oerskovii]|uniref:Uncharacterized protein n=1 Tax=Ancylobacter oerskovii TaxID=459519 RepID=A0ABW4YS07_9HYPH|nr:hypothetical protein [Ancylobacter oerskovii]MBS7545674.1 hypothetical protein [Ancylobacter oerskovii]
MIDFGGPTYMGLRIVQSRLLERTIEDWSRVRSPSRAARRRRRGHRQNIDVTVTPDPAIYRVGDTMVMHPATYLELRRRLDAQKAGVFA